MKKLQAFRICVNVRRVGASARISACIRPIDQCVVGKANFRFPIQDQSTCKSRPLLFDVRRYPISLTSNKSRSEEHTSELQSLMRISYAVFCLKKKNTNNKKKNQSQDQNQHNAPKKCSIYI